MKKVKSKNRRLKNRCSKNNRLKNSRQKNKRKKRQSTNIQSKSEQAKNKQPESKQQKVEQTESSQPENKQPQKLQKPKKRGTAQKIFTAVCITLCVFLIPLVITNLILIIKGYTNKDEVPSLFSISPMYVITDSMVPTINAGDLIFVKKIAPEDIAVDDIITFFDPESMSDPIMIVHRVKEISTDGEGNISFRTKGDANNVYDTFIITGDHVVGRYLFRIRGMGNVAMFMQTTYGLIITLSIPLLMLIGYEVVRQFVLYKKERANNKITQKESD